MQPESTPDAAEARGASPPIVLPNGVRLSEATRAERREAAAMYSAEADLLRALSHYKHQWREHRGRIGKHIPGAIKFVVAGDSAALRPGGFWPSRFKAHFLRAPASDAAEVDSVSIKRLFAEELAVGEIGRSE